MRAADFSCFQHVGQGIDLIETLTGGEHGHIGKGIKSSKSFGKEDDLEDYEPEVGFAGGEHAQIGRRIKMEAEFIAGEHDTIGKEIDLGNLSRKEFAGSERAQIGNMVDSERDEMRKLVLPNGVKIKFEQIIALAGDHYGVPEHPVVDPSSQQGMHGRDSGSQQRFLNAYNTLARGPKEELQKELEKLLAALDKEIETGESVSNKEWDEITGGKWFLGFPIKKGRMLQLALNNHDHFLPYAKDAYLTGHLLALDKAREAREYPGDKRKMLLHEAYSLDAFACHFLTDSFASGHIR